MRSRSPSSSNSETGSDSEAYSKIECPALPIIAQSFINRILWPTTAASVNGISELVAPVDFNDRLIDRVRASVEFAFRSAERPLKTASPNATALYCPLPLGNPILDAMVKLIADQVHADVVELDALELVTGSVLRTSDETDAIPQAVFKADAQDSSEIQRIAEFFTALINIPSKSGAKRRVIYLRDIGSIATCAKPLTSLLMKAIWDNRQKDDRALAIILVLGVSAGLKTKEVNVDNGSKISSIVSQTLLEAVPITVAPASLLPSLKEMICDPDRLTVAELAPLVFAANNSTSRPPRPPKRRGPLGPFHSLFNDDSDSADDSDDDNLGKIWHYCGSTVAECSYEVLDTAMQNTPVVVVEPESSEESDLQLLQQKALTSRVETINRAVIQTVAQSSGICLSKEAEDSWLALVCAEDKIAGQYLRLSILRPSHAHLVLSVAIGLFPGHGCDRDVDVPVLTPDQITRAHEVSMFGNGEPTHGSNSAFSGKSTNTAADRVARIKNKRGLGEKERNFISCIVQPENLQKTDFDDVIIDPKIKKTLHSIISLPLLQSRHFDTGILANEALSGILLYGPPGTGKTMVCRALAADFDVPMLLVQPSDIFDKYLGESEKLAKAVFSLANQIAPCIVFIDEVDSLLGSRGKEDSCSSVRRAMLTEIMQAMDGIQTGGKNGVVVIGATNRPYDLDEAILRRLPRRMMVDLPTWGERKEILKLYLRSETCAQDLDIDDLARRTHQFSGSDLKNLCVSAAIEAVNDSILIPPPAIVEITDSEETLKPLRVINSDHFNRALGMISPSFSYEANAELYRWHQKHSGVVGQPNMAGNNMPDQTKPAGNNMPQFAQAKPAGNNMPQFAQAKPAGNNMPQFAQAKPAGNMPQFDQTKLVGNNMPQFDQTKLAGNNMPQFAQLAKPAGNMTQFDQTKLAGNNMLQFAQLAKLAGNMTQFDQTKLAGNNMPQFSQLAKLADNSMPQFDQLAKSVGNMPQFGQLAKLADNSMPQFDQLAKSAENMPQFDQTKLAGNNMSQFAQQAKPAANNVL